MRTEDCETAAADECDGVPCPTCSRDVPRGRLLLAYGALSVIVMSAAFWSMLDYAEHASVSALQPLALVLLFLLGWFFFRLCRVFSSDAASMFLLIAVPAVSAFGLFILPGWVPDEQVHLAQAFSLFGRHDGAWRIPAALASEDVMPGTYRDAYRLLAQSDTWGSLSTFSRFLSGYYDHLYALSALIVTVCRALGVNAYLACFACRIANGLLFTACGYWMIRVMPFGKTALFVFLLNPMLVQQEASFSADCVANIVSLAFVVYFIAVFCSKAISRRQVLVLIALGVLVLVSKYMFAPLLLLPLLFLKRRFDGRTCLKIYIGLFALMMLMAGAVVILYHGSFMADAFELMRSPKAFLRIMLNTFYIMVPTWMRWYFGSNLGRLSIGLWEPALWAYAAMQFVVLFYNDEDNERVFDTIDKVVVCVLCFVNFVLIILTMRGWTLTVDKVSDYIMGVQGRYLFPLGLLLLMCVLRPHKKISQGGVLVTVACLIVACYVMNMPCILASFGVALFPL